MHLSILLISLILTLVNGYPLATRDDGLTQDLIHIAKLLDNAQIGNCSNIKATLPLNDTNPKLPPVSPGLTLKHVALGRGTQNYTCSSSDETATPAADGALATLFDASCLASSYPDLLHELPAALAGVPLDSLSFLATLFGQLTSAKTGSLILGKHYFTQSKSPFFDLRLSGQKDWALAKQNASVSAPARSRGSSGPSCDNGTQDVPWLKLKAISGTGIQEVYRVETYGGEPPATCKGQKDSFEVEYAAEYWFYG